MQLPAGRPAPTSANSPSPSPSPSAPGGCSTKKESIYLQSRPLTETKQLQTPKHPEPEGTYSFRPIQSPIDLSIRTFGSRSPHPEIHPAAPRLRLSSFHGAFPLASFPCARLLCTERARSELRGLSRERTNRRSPSKLSRLHAYTRAHSAVIRSHAMHAMHTTYTMYTRSAITPVDGAGPFHKPI